MNHPHSIITGVVAVVALVVAAFVEVNGGDPDQYLNVALVATGYLAGRSSAAVASKKRSPESGT